MLTDKVHLTDGQRSYQLDARVNQKIPPKLSLIWRPMMRHLLREVRFVVDGGRLLTGIGQRIAVDV